MLARACSLLAILGACAAAAGAAPVLELSRGGAAAAAPAPARRTFNISSWGTADAAGAAVAGERLFFAGGKGHGPGGESVDVVVYSGGRFSQLVGVLSAARAQIREKEIGCLGGSISEPPGPLLTHLHTVYMAYSECLPSTRLNPQLAEIEPVSPRRRWPRPRCRTGASRCSRAARTRPR
jgi:hypothetical protein